VVLWPLDKFDRGRMRSPSLTHDRLMNSCRPPLQMRRPAVDIERLPLIRLESRRWPVANKRTILAACQVGLPDYDTGGPPLAAGEPNCVQ
jgi:hypothetical protein